MSAVSARRQSLAIAERAVTGVTVRAVVSTFQSAPSPCGSLTLHTMQNTDDQQSAMAEYKRYARACERIRDENEKLLKEFAAWMEKQGTSERTVWIHFSNVSFYIQYFLLDEQPLRPQEGSSYIDMYLGSWFIRKGPIATPGTVGTNATSLARFYSFLVEKGLVAAKDLEQMRKTIKENRRVWQERARRYNNPAISNWRGTDWQL